MANIQRHVNLLQLIMLIVEYVSVFMNTVKIKKSFDEKNSDFSKALQYIYQYQG